MNYLIFVRHSIPVIDQRIPANQWNLSLEGAKRLDILAPMLEKYAPQRILSSPEVKAVETARIIGDKYGLQIEIKPNLSEHLLSNEDFLSASEFRKAVQKLFAKKNELVFGLETAEQACDRFEAVVDNSCNECYGSNLIFVTHGRILSSYISRKFGIDAYTFWEYLKLPDFVAMTQSGDRLIEARDLPW